MKGHAAILCTRQLAEPCMKTCTRFFQSVDIGINRKQLLRARVKLALNHTMTSTFLITSKQIHAMLT